MTRLYEAHDEQLHVKLQLLLTREFMRPLGGCLSIDSGAQFAELDVSMPTMVDNGFRAN